MKALATQMRHVGDYSPDLAEALLRGRLDAAILRVEPDFPMLRYERIASEPLVVLMPCDHALARRKEIDPQDLVAETFIIGSRKAAVLRQVTEDYLKRSGIVIKPAHGVDNIATAISLVASTHGVALMPSYAEKLLPSSVVSRPIKGDKPTIDLMLGYNGNNDSLVLKRLLQHLAEVRKV